MHKALALVAGVLLLLATACVSAAAQTSTDLVVVDKVFDAKSAEMIQSDLLAGEIHRYLESGG